MLDPNRDNEGMTERFEMVYNEAFYKLGSGEVGISPHSWYHQCTSLNTLTGQQTLYSGFYKQASGHLTVVVNGKVLHDKIEPFFGNSVSVKPDSLKGERFSF